MFVKSVSQCCGMALSVALRRVSLVISPFHIDKIVRDKIPMTMTMTKFGQLLIQ